MTSLNMTIALNAFHATLNALLLYATFLIADNAHLPRYHNLLHQFMVKMHTV